MKRPLSCMIEQLDLIKCWKLLEMNNIKCKSLAAIPREAVKLLATTYELQTSNFVLSDEDIQTFTNRFELSSIQTKTRQTIQTNNEILSGLKKAFNLTSPIYPEPSSTPGDPQDRRSNAKSEATDSAQTSATDFTFLNEQTFGVIQQLQTPGDSTTPPSDLTPELLHLSTEREAEFKLQQIQMQQVLSNIKEEN